MEQTKEKLQAMQEKIDNLKTELHKVIVGQHEMTDLIIAAILANGHILLEGVPGIAKTLTAKLTARALSVNFSRIQFTPDLMPSDVIGTSVFNMKKSEFEFKAGPVFANIVLIDEINRSPAKTQSALFEVMEERQITSDGTTYQMENLFLVLATQNPVEHEGTYRLPEAQLDRFLFKIEIDYPSLEEENQILISSNNRKNASSIDAIQPVLSAEDIKEYQDLIHEVYIEPQLIDYIAKIVNRTRNHNSIYLGGSPRASLAILSGSKALAAMQGRNFVTPDDIKRVCYPALIHRIILTPEKEMEGIRPAQVIKNILDSLEVPR